MRFEEGTGGLEIDVSVAASRRGSGVGRALLQHGLTAAAARWKPGTLVIANVLEGNVESLRLFEGSGFVHQTTGISNDRRFRRLERVL